MQISDMFCLNLILFYFLFLFQTLSTHFVQLYPSLIRVKDVLFFYLSGSLIPFRFSSKFVPGGSVYDLFSYSVLLGELSKYENLV